MKTSTLTGVCSLLLMLATPYASPARADSDQDAQDLSNLMTMLQEETKVATQSRMNADFVPGSVTVLHGDELRKFGFRNLGQALDMVTGVLVSADNVGTPVTIVRGIGGTLGSSNIKVLLDGVPVNDPVSGEADAVLHIPISQLDRVEVIRGPGSALYGEFAFSGVVNFITRQDSNSAGASVGSHVSREYHAMASGSKGSNVQWHLNASQWRQGNSGRPSGLDNFGVHGVGYSPGTVYDHDRGQMLLAGLNLQGYQLGMQYVDTVRGPEFGYTTVLPQELAPRTESLLTLNLAHTWQLAQTLALDLSLNGQQGEYKGAQTLPIPKGVDPPGPRPLLTTDIYRRDGFNDSSYRMDATLHWHPLPAHQLLLGLGYERLRVDDSFLYTEILGQSPVYASPDSTPVVAGSRREVTSVTLQDQWHLRDDLDITAGARYDRYDDAGTNTSPRLAAVWRPSERHIFKAQYAEAFRPPTLGETYPGPNSVPSDIPGGVTSNLTAEDLRSTELSYIYRRSAFTVRTTLYHTHVRNLIEFFFIPGQHPIWRNHGTINAQGIEWEWQQHFGREWQLISNLSYGETRDEVAQDRLIGSVQWLANLGVVWNQSAHQSHGLRLRYVGTQQGWAYNPQTQNLTQFPSRITLNYTWTLDQVLGYEGLQLQAGINNLTDKTFAVTPDPNFFPNGLTQDGRTFWVGFHYQFDQAAN